MSQQTTVLGTSAQLWVRLLQKLKDATPLTQPMRYGGTSNVRRYYEDIPLPDRLFVLGDSAVAFNPVRGRLPPPRLDVTFIALQHKDNNHARSD